MAARGVSPAGAVAARGMSPAGAVAARGMSPAGAVAARGVSQRRGRLSAWCRDVGKSASSYESAGGSGSKSSALSNRPNRKGLGDATSPHPRQGPKAAADLNWIMLGGLKINCFTGLLPRVSAKLFSKLQNSDV